MEIVNKNIEEIKMYENNPRNNDGAVEYVANSIKEPSNARTPPLCKVASPFLIKLKAFLK